MKQLLFAAAAAALIATVGTAEAASRTFEVPSFTKIEISSGINAAVTIGDTLSVIAESPVQEELDELLVEVRDGKLHAWTDWSFLDLFDWADAERQIRITIVVPALSEVNANSGSDVDVTGISGELVVLRSSSGADLDVTAAAGANYDIESSSGSHLTVAGTCTGAKAASSSGSNLNAEKLLCIDVDANASSGADLDVYASGSVKANASSGSDITVHGAPASTEVESSSGADITIAN